MGKRSNHSVSNSLRKYDKRIARISKTKQCSIEKDGYLTNKIDHHSPTNSGKLDGIASDNGEEKLERLEIDITVRN